jgi:hypothetical protein
VVIEITWRGKKKEHEAAAPPERDRRWIFLGYGWCGCAGFSWGRAAEVPDDAGIFPSGSEVRPGFGFAEAEDDAVHLREELGHFAEFRAQGGRETQDLKTQNVRPREEEKAGFALMGDDIEMAGRVS